MDSNIERLLILQDRDMRRLSLITSLEAVPVEVAKAREQIRKEQAQVQQQAQRLQQLEVQRRELALQNEQAQEKIVRYKTQQLQVKKNEEYQALGHQIDTEQAFIAQLEDEELELLMSIDQQKATLAQAESAAAEQVVLYEREITRQQALEKELQSQRADAEQAVQTASAAVSGEYMEAYQRVAMRKAKQPWVVAVEDRRCGGCHLKVSGEAESAAREQSRPVHCDSCGRVIYWQ